MNFDRFENNIRIIEKLNYGINKIYQLICF
jgi:hypothetical protein